MRHLRRRARRRAERLFVAAFYTALQSGAADEILDGLRPAFDTAAAAITVASGLVVAGRMYETHPHDQRGAV